MLRCLKERGASELTAAAAANAYWFRPVVDLNITHSKAVLKDFPRKLYERGEVARVPYLCGLTQNEGSLVYYLKYPELVQAVTASRMREAIERMIRPFLRRYTNSKVVAASIDYYYIQRVNHSSGVRGFGRQNLLPPNKDEKMIEVSAAARVLLPVVHLLSFSSIKTPFFIHVLALGVNVHQSLSYSPAKLSLRLHHHHFPHAECSICRRHSIRESGLAL